MNVYEYAMKIEKEGEIYYRDLAAKTSDAGLKEILNMLAEEEVKHYIVFEKMNNNQNIPTQKEVDVFAAAKTIFQKMKDDKTFGNFAASQVEFYKNALKTEEESYKFYVEKALLLEDASQKAAFLRIAEEEKQHMVLLGNLVDYISAPEAWIEHAEFSNMSIAKSGN